VNVNLTHIISILKASHQIDISMYDSEFLSGTVNKRISQTGSTSADDYYKLLEHSITEPKQFVDSLQISYSEFFRNSLTYAALEHIILPALISKLKNSGRREIRIWSTSCANGQEAYSLAMLLEELKYGEKNKFKYRIFATDRSQSNIKTAKIGKYTAELLKNIQLKRLNKWFTNNNELYSVDAGLKENIFFSEFDLLDEGSITPESSIYGDFDLVYCANLLFYYNNEVKQKILRKVSHCLSKDGYLVTGETEREILLKQKYIEIVFQSSIFQVNNV
jgi:chemotaxis methyl-accepting protein methylase